MTKAEALARIAAKDPRYRVHLPGGAATPKPKRPGGCAHLGERSGQYGVCAEGCGEDRTRIPLQQCAIHTLCSVAVRTKENHACCKGCLDFETRTYVESRATVVVPQPPPLALTPSSPRAIVTVAAGEAGRELLAAAGRHMRAYAARVGADFVVLDWPGHPDWPMSAKFAIPRVLDHYERIAYVDADVLLRPGAVNLFDACAPDELGLYDELPFQLLRPEYGVIRRYHRSRRDSGFPPLEHTPFYLNCGVMVIPRQYARLLYPPAHPLRVYNCGEQDQHNAVIHREHAAGRLKLRLLDRRCNSQNWTFPYHFQGATDDAVLHWSGGGHDRQWRAANIAEWAAKTPTCEPYCIASTQRSGSTLLAEGLQSVGLGEPGEHFLLQHIDKSPGLSTEEALALTTRSGAAKCHYKQFRERGLGHHAALPWSRWVWITRSDEVAQAVSYSRAVQTRSFRSDHVPQAAPEYKPDHIAKLLGEVREGNAGWGGYFAEKGITPMRVSYEELVADYPGTVKRVAAFLGAEVNHVPPPALVKQGDALNEEWAERFRSEG